MVLFELPSSTRVDRIIPKNAFDGYVSTKQKKLFTEFVSRITWLNKLSSETLHLEAKEIKEIQVFKVELKAKDEAGEILDIIDKAIPYNIIFTVVYDNWVYLSTSVKHPHPIHEDNAVIDWTFKTSWFLPSKNPYLLQLKSSIDSIYHNFCLQILGKPELAKKPLREVIQYQKEVDSLKQQIQKLQRNMAQCKQFKQKVELNEKLKWVEGQLNKLLSQ